VQSLLAPRLSLAVGIAIFGLKYLAYRLTGSVALYSDALESIVNIAAALVVLLTITIARRPADAKHPFGHSKVEYLSAVLEGVLIVVAALAIVQSAWERLLRPVVLVGLTEGVTLSLAASGLNGMMAFYLVRLGRRERSPALVADGMHLGSDVITSAGVLLGIGLAWLTGWWLLDPLIALLGAVNILRIGWKLVRDSIGGLIDEGLPEVEAERVRQVIEDNLQEAIEVHALRTRRAGRLTFIDFHLIVPSNMMVSDAHAICDHLEGVIERVAPGSKITIHIEPEDKAEHRGFVVRTGR